MRRPPVPRGGGGSGGGVVRLRLVFLVVAVSLVGVSISSVRYLASTIANSHHAASQYGDLKFEDEKGSWHHTWGRAVSHIDETIRRPRTKVLRSKSLNGGSEVVATGPDPSAAAHSAKPVPQRENNVASAAASTGSGQSSAHRQQEQRRQQQPTCRVKKLDRTEYWGDVVGEWGTNRKLDSAEECCLACQSYTPPTPDDPECNVWVYCGRESECKHQYKECWLKHLAWVGASKPNSGPNVPWTSGVVDSGQHDSEQDAPRPEEEANPEERAFHTVTSAQGSATHWQMRVHYYWWKKRKAECLSQGKCMMGGFTRLLHSGVKDDLMGEIPTVVVDPLPKETPNRGYVVLNRPYAFVQWLRKSPPPEKYILMSEPDHIFLKPMPNLMRGDRPAAFPFFYIEPAKPEHKPITEKFLGPLTREQAEKIAPIGSSPTFITKEDLTRMSPVWMNMSIAIFNDPEAHKAWGWVLEMYGFTLAMYKLGIGPVDVHIKMMAQPPFDSDLEPYNILHFTYGMDYTKEGVFTPGKYGEWRFDKRSYATRPIPRNMELPPAGCTNQLVRRLIEMFNEATDSIPNWDTYVKTFRG